MYMLYMCKFIIIYLNIDKKTRELKQTLFRTRTQPVALIKLPCYSYRMIALATIISRSNIMPEY
jgi:hypothetical protein